MKTKLQTYQAQWKFRENQKSLKKPSYLIELAFFAVTVYANLAPAYGLAFPLVGAGSMAGLAVFCFLHFGSRSIGAFKPVAFALGCAAAVLFIQTFIHEEPFSSAWLRYFITWTLSLLVIQSLSYRRGFLHRFAILCFLIGCATLPFLKMNEVNEMIRVGGGGGVALANPNYFGMWFGFCTVYFLIAGLEAKNYIIRTAAWSCGILCLFLMALSVSRGALLGVAIAIVLGCEKILKRSFLPVLGFLLLLWVIYVSGIFDNLIGYYSERGMEETGRSRLWIWAFWGFLDAWWVGVGFSNAVIGAQNGEGGFGPHNSFLFIGLSSGIIPLALYIAYLGRVTRGAFKARKFNTPDSPYILPLVSFAMLELTISDGFFMSAWHVAVLSSALVFASFVKKIRRSSGNLPSGQTSVVDPDVKAKAENG